MDVAVLTSNLSSAVRLKVGAVAVKDRRIVACGYNGKGQGEDNCCEDTLPDGRLVTKLNVIHAEDNLIRFARGEGVNLHSCAIYITHAPCVGCATKIWQAGFTKVIYLYDYRDHEGINLLKEKYLVVEKYNYG